MKGLGGETRPCILMNILNTLFATGAYGRKYSSNIEAMTDWFIGKDFKVVSGPYFSIRDTDVLLADGYDRVDVDGHVFPLV